jgi:dTDP-4-amino-4,6-dideoxygalactose transaminase
MSKRHLPFVDLAAKQARFAARYQEDLARVLASGYFILGNEVSSFENAVVQFTGAAHAVGVANGTDALVLCLRAIGVGSGDEVITTPMSYLATTSAIALSGATAVFTDIDDSLNLDPDKIEGAITSRTKAISVVHLAGIPAQMDRIVAIADRHGLAVIEDCAQSFGAVYDGKAAGTFGRFGAISFHPLKNLGALGDGGMILVREPKDAAWLRQARNHGHRSREECDFWTINSRLDELQAAFLRTQLEFYPEELSRRRRLAEVYRSRLAGVAEFPKVPAHGIPAYNWIMVLASRRERLMAFLMEQGIETKVHYPMLIPSLVAAARNTRSDIPTPNAQRLVDQIMSLPSAEHVTEDDAHYVCSIFERFYDGRGNSAS